MTGAATYRVDLGVLPGKAWPLVPPDVRAESLRMWEWAVGERRTLGLAQDVFMTCDAIKRLWRRRHLKIVKFWNDLEEGFKAVVWGDVRLANVGRVQIDKVGAWVRIRLPSGRYLSYPGAKVEGQKITYLGQNQYTRQWGPIGTYGGKLSENITQAMCRDLLADGLLNCEEWGLPVVLHVHDEIVVEHAFDQQDRLADCMRAVEWADGLPLAVATYATDRYHKE